MNNEQREVLEALRIDHLAMVRIVKTQLAEYLGQLSPAAETALHNIRIVHQARADEIESELRES